MKTEFKYAIKEIVKHPVSYIILLFQLFVSFYALFLALNLTINIAKENLKLKNSIENKNGYVLNSSSDDETFFKTAKLWNNGSARQRELYKFMEDNSYFKHVVMEMEKICTYETPLYHLDKNMYVKYGYDSSLGYELRDLSCIFINKHFFNTFDLEFSDKSSEVIDYEYTGSQVNIVLGYDFKKYYKISDVIHIPSTLDSFFPNSGVDMDLKIVGFLKKGSYCFLYNNRHSPEKLINLDKKILAPINSNMDSSDPRFKNATSAFDQILSGVNILAPDIDMAIEKLHEFSVKKNLYTYPKITSWSSILKDIIKTTKIRSSGIYFTFFCLLGFTILGIVFSMLMFIKKERYKIGINLLCGSSLNKIILRFIIQTALVVFLALLTNIFILPFNLEIFGYMLAIAMFLVILIILPVGYRLKQKSINEFLRRKE
ncbi:MAG: hypothetical protein FWC41_02990 [Firmicutes bacterium]|nr:hypothetical protein [Bacillota bacterium]